MKQCTLVAFLIVGGGLVAKSTLADDPVKTEEPHKFTNALIDSTSPYLLQHAHNPVNWLPWGAAAFEKARRENKPVFVSIGYSTCYWCHVMERESFEDEQVAKVLNEHYVAIKVDREQRPDIDEQLMLATQLMTGRGGWPNSIWLTSDGRPWMAGTYFPKAQFIGALESLARVWRDEAEAVQKQANALSDAIREASAVKPPPASAELDASPMHRAMAELNQLFDPQYGGFGSKPKFPPHGQLLLLAHQADAGDAQAWMLTKTLDAIWCGGIHDHIGGGFHRYSTDERWFLPHFEKMLYDNAQLMRAYAEAFRVTQQPRYRAAVEDIFVWLEREMTHPLGGFYSALDSESDGEEGRFYTWSMSELEQVLTSQDARLFAQTYNFAESGNFVEEATGQRPGTNIPHLNLNSLGEESAQPSASLARVRAQLLQSRSSREYPHLDDKIITAWNGLMIGALARAGHSLQEPKYIEAAEKAAQFVLTNLRNERRQLLRNWRAGQADGLGYLNDYAFFTQALLELHQAAGDAQWLDEARTLCDAMRVQFSDRAAGGFYFTSLEHEELLVRSKNLTGGGNLPTGNGVAAEVLLDLYLATGDEKYLAEARRTLNAFSSLMRSSPRQVEHLVLAGSRLLSIDSQRSRTAGNETPADSQQSQAVTARLFVANSSASAGTEVQVAVEIEIAEGFHLYGPLDEDATAVVKPVTIALSEQAGLRAGTLSRPPGKRAMDQVLGQQITTYVGRVRFGLPIAVAETAAAGELPLAIQVTFQACDDRTCLRPETLLLKSTLTVASKP